MVKKNHGTKSFLLFSLLLGIVSFIKSSDKVPGFKNFPKNRQQQIDDLIKEQRDSLDKGGRFLGKAFSNYFIPAVQTGYEKTKKYIIPAVQVCCEKTKGFIKEKQIECRQGSDSIVRQENENVEQPPCEMTTLKNAVNDTVSFASKKFNEKVVSETSLLDEDIQNTITKEFDEVSADAVARHDCDFKTYVDRNKSEDDFVERKLVTLEFSMMKVGMAGAIFVGLSYALYKLYEKYCKKNNSHVDEQVE